VPAASSDSSISLEFNEPFGTKTVIVDEPYTAASGKTCRAVEFLDSSEDGLRVCRLGEGFWQVNDALFTGDSAMLPKAAPPLASALPVAETVLVPVAIPVEVPVAEPVKTPIDPFSDRSK